MLIYKAFRWVQHLQNLTFSDLNSIKNPYTLTRMPPTQCPLSGKVAPPPNSRDAQMSFLQGADPLDPRAPQRPHPHPKNPPRDPPGPGEGRGAKGPKGPGAIRGGWAHGALWVIPKPFRMVSYSEASPNGRAVPNGWLFRKGSYAICSNSRENAEPNVGGTGWILVDLNGFEWIIDIYIDFVD